LKIPACNSLSRREDVPAFFDRWERLENENRRSRPRFWWPKKPSIDFPGILLEKPRICAVIEV